jgi:hypothetical protein
VRVDGTPYSIFGASAAVVELKQLNVSDGNVTDTVITPTQITLVAQAGPMQVNMSFFNPVEVRSKFFNSMKLDSRNLFSQGIGSGNQYPSHTSPLWHSRLMVQLIKWKCILTLAHVCEIILRTIVYLLKIVDWVSTTDVNTEVLQWNVISNDEVIYHTSTLLPPVLLSEDFSQARWGTFYYATKAVSVFYSFRLVSHGPCI